MLFLMLVVAGMAGGGGGGGCGSGCGWGGGGGCGWGCGWGGGCGSGCGYWGPGPGCYGPGCAGWNGYAWGTPWGCYWTESAVCPSGNFYYPLAWPGGSPWFPPADASAATGVADAALEDQLRSLKDQLRRLEAAEASSGPAAPARVVVKVPAGAALYIGDKPWSLDPVTRSFASPALRPGLTYRYTLKAEVKRDGRTLTESKRVTVHAGDEVVVDFGSLGAAPAGVR